LSTSPTISGSSAEVGSSKIKTFENKLDDLKNPYNEYLKNNVLAEDLENLENDREDNREDNELS